MWTAPLAAILSYNTIAHNGGCCRGRAPGGQNFLGGPILELYSALLTLAILVLSEIFPQIPWGYLLETNGSHNG